VRTIPLTQGHWALIDDADFEAVVAAGPWFANGRTNLYAVHSTYINRVRGTMLMHNFITGWKFVDHANGNSLDNRRQNLRPANTSTNGANSKIRSDNTSGFKGVSPRQGIWRARIHVNGREIPLGRFGSPIEAALAYDAAALHHFGEYARPNFPQEVSA